MLQLPGVVLALGGVGKMLLGCLGETWRIGVQEKELHLAPCSILSLRQNLRGVGSSSLRDCDRDATKLPQRNGRSYFPSKAIFFAPRGCFQGFVNGLMY